MSTLNNTTVNGVITQTMAASQPNHCVRLGEAQALMASLFQGVWNNATTYTAGQMATDTPAGGSVSLYTANQTTLNQQPSLNPSVWRLAAAGGGAGASAYVYVAYASDNLGTGFSLTPASGRPGSRRCGPRQPGSAMSPMRPCAAPSTTATPPPS